MLNLAQKQEVTAQVYALLEKANEDLGANIGVPIIDFTLRGTTAGTARGDFELNFNAQLMVDNWETFKTDTIIHEVAHLVCHNKYGTERSRSGNRIAHGDNWKRIMRQLGGNPTRTHNMDVSKTAQPKRKFIYICDCCKTELTLTSVRHNKLLRNPTQYSHCRGSKLTFKQALGKVSYAEAAQMKNTKPATKTAPKTTKPKATKAKTPVKRKTATKKKVTKISIADRVTNIFKKAHIENPEVTRQEIIKLITKAFKLDADPKGKMKASNYYTTAKKKAA